MQKFSAIKSIYNYLIFLISRDRVERANALPYTWELREKQTQLEWFKVVASYLLSNIGLFALTVLYAIIGKCIISFSFINSDTNEIQFQGSNS